ncbi:MAG: ATP-dependent RNA helicase HrpA [Gammaproteobacteria bacterium]|nr:ATP-dependent RNA helicase HrpA [Gammaproteobacteria bacterium]
MPTPADFQHLTRQLDAVMQRDRQRLWRRVQQLRGEATQANPESVEKLRLDITTSIEESARRLALVGRLEYPPQLPVVERREELLTAIRDHQVVIICGETGSGKTTQLPKLCLELGRGARGMIGHTQPRRIAARNVAQRIAQELHTDIGAIVGYQVRFTDRVGQNSLIKLMTDGILLAELQQDRFLNQYDTIIIDEAHERSLNIDFLLGVFKTLLPKRPDLKLIVTSATIDPQRFSQFFSGAPVIEVSGRTFPVEVRYRSLVSEADDSEERDFGQALCGAVDELARLGPGDILVFLSGEREIRESAEILRKHHPTHTEILPLYARLSAEEQQRVFSNHGGRRIILATNVAETSLTVPGVRYVIDTGTARISRYNYRTKIQRLPIEKISQASANQRSGRCGRVASGVAIRLYGEDDFNTRAPFTEPEITRTNLASVILQMKVMRLGDIEDFPFIEPPDSRYIKDGYRLLFELGAVDEGGALQPLGKTLARFPVDPQIARMLVQAERERCVNEVLIIAAVLSIQDPRERPYERAQAADNAHRQFANTESDFLSQINLWNFLQEQKAHLSNAKFRRLCEQTFLSFMRVREWYDVYTQLKHEATEIGWRLNETPATYEQLHRALLAGLLGSVGTQSEVATSAPGAAQPRAAQGSKEYVGARNIKFMVFPGSGLAKKPPKWLMAAEIVDTARVYARTVARIDPEWLEALAPHLMKHHYSEPHWEKKSGHVGAFERVTFYGLTVVAKRRVNYAKIDPVHARELFIRAALVNGDYDSRADFFRHNQALIAEVSTLEDKARRRDILVDDESLFQFYNARIPADINNAPAFEIWRSEQERASKQHLFLTKEFLIQQQPQYLTAQQFPDHLVIAGARLPLHYHFAPGDDDDGVSVRVPVALLPQIDAAQGEWLVPGLIHEKVTELIRGLPKALRKNFVPAPEFARAALDAVPFGEGRLLVEISARLKRMSGIDLPLEVWDTDKLPKHLMMRYVLTDDSGKELLCGRDLDALRAQLVGRPPPKNVVVSTPEVEVRGTTWVFGELPQERQEARAGYQLRVYPTLRDERDSVVLTHAQTLAEAEALLAPALRRLLRFACPQQILYLQKHLPEMQRMCLLYQSVGGCEELKQDIIDSALDRTFLAEGAMPRDETAFLQRVEARRADLIGHGNDIAQAVYSALQGHAEVQKMLKGAINPARLPLLNDLKDQASRLIYRGFVSATPQAWLAHYPRYYKAMLARSEKAKQYPDRDNAQWRVLEPIWREFWGLFVLPKYAAQPDWQELRWWLEELRVSLFAQELRTAITVSPQRVEKRLQALKKLG